jgi:hypothetical protein
VNTATLARLASRQARAIRTAISPRLAIRTLRTWIPRTQRTQSWSRSTPDRVVLIVTRAAGEQVDLIGDDGGNQDRQVGELAIEPRPQAGGRGGIERLRGRGPGYLPVHGWVAELGRIGGGGAIGGYEVGAIQLPDEVIGRGIVGTPAAVDYLGVVA